MMDSARLSACYKTCLTLNMLTETNWARQNNLDSVLTPTAGCVKRHRRNCRTV